MMNSRDDLQLNPNSRNFIIISLGFGSNVGNRITFDVEIHDNFIIRFCAKGRYKRIFHVKLPSFNRLADTCPMEGFDSRSVKNPLNLPRDAEINRVVSCDIRQATEGIWGERFRISFEQVYHQLW